MAALTQQQWYDKISKWVPVWFFENENLQVAVFQAMAKLLESMDEEMRAQFDESFISRAANLTLDQHGYERSIFRLTGESDTNYALRIRNMTTSLDPVSLEALVNSLLLTGTCVLTEHDYEGNFLGIDSFMDRSTIFTDIFYCVFSIIFEYQGASQEAEDAIMAIATAVNASKALGTLYRITELNA